MQRVALSIKTDIEIMRAIDDIVFDHRRTSAQAKAVSRTTIINEMLKEALVSRGRLPGRVQE